MSNVLKSYVQIGESMSVGTRFPVNRLKQEEPSSHDDATGSTEDETLRELSNRYEQLLLDIAQAEETLGRRLEEADREISALMEQAMRDAEQIRRDAYTEGRSEGLHDASSDMEHLKSLAIKESESLMKSARAEANQWLRDSEPMIVDLAIDIATQVIRDELHLHRDHIVGLVREAVASMETSLELEVHVHPDDYDIVAAQRESWQPTGGRVSRISIVPDLGVASGGCIVHSSADVMDATVETRLDVLAKVLREAVSERCQ